MLARFMMRTRFKRHENPGFDLKRAILMYRQQGMDVQKWERVLLTGTRVWMKI